TFLSIRRVASGVFLTQTLRHRRALIHSDEQSSRRALFTTFPPRIVVQSTPGSGVLSVRGGVGICATETLQERGHVFMRIRTTIQICLLVLLSFPAFGTDPEPLRSPKLEALRIQVVNSVPNAEEQFFTGLIPPIIEPVEGDETHKLVTFVFRGKADTKRVTVLGARPVTDFDAPLENLPGTRVWYRTEKLPSDSRFAYFFNVDLPAEKSDLVADLLSAPDPLPDPLNPNHIDDGSYVVLPGALPFPFT